jgi:hypothetical protein
MLQNNFVCLWLGGAHCTVVNGGTASDQQCMSQRCSVMQTAQCSVVGDDCAAGQQQHQQQSQYSPEYTLYTSAGYVQLRPVLVLEQAAVAHTSSSSKRSII